MGKYDDEYGQDEYAPRRRKRKRSSGNKKSSGMSPLVIVGIVFGCMFAFCIICGGIGFVMMKPTLNNARTIARASASKNNLKQIGLALHNYHDVYKTFPPGGVFDPVAKKNRHSWMTMLLPYIDYPHFYNEISQANGFNVPWDAPRHQMIFSQTMRVYLNPDINHPQVDGYAAAHYAGNSQLFYRNSRTRIRDVRDGSSNTIMAGEVSSNFMAWGNPENIRDPANGVSGAPNGFGSPSKRDGAGGAQVLMVDGSVRFISNKVDPKILKALSTPAGGEAVDEY